MWFARPVNKISFNFMWIPKIFYLDPTIKVKKNKQTNKNKNKQNKTKNKTKQNKQTNKYKNKNKTHKKYKYLCFPWWMWPKWSIVFIYFIIVLWIQLILQNNTQAFINPDDIVLSIFMLSFIFVIVCGTPEYVNKHINMNIIGFTQKS